MRTKLIGSTKPSTESEIVKIHYAARESEKAQSTQLFTKTTGIQNTSLLCTTAKQERIPKHCQRATLCSGQAMLYCSPARALRKHHKSEGYHQTGSRPSTSSSYHRTEDFHDTRRLLLPVRLPAELIVASLHENFRERIRQLFPAHNLAQQFQRGVLAHTFKVYNGIRVLG